MRLTITSSFSGVGAQPAPFILGDDADGRIIPIGQNFTFGAPGGIVEYLPKNNIILDKRALVRAPYKTGFTRFNEENSITLSVSRTFTNRELAVKFRDNHADLVPVSGLITKTEISATGRIVSYLPNAFREGIQCVKNQGVTIVFRYNFWAGNAWQTQI